MLLRCTQFARLETPFLIGTFGHVCCRYDLCALSSALEKREPAESEPRSALAAPVNPS